MYSGRTSSRKERVIKPQSKAILETPQALVDLVVRSLDDDKAEDVVVIDLRGKSSIADHMVIASGRSTRQVGAMASHLSEKLKHAGQGVGVEGMGLCDWVLVDGGDIVVHLFRPEIRAFYSLEKMWGVGKADVVAASL